MVLLVALDISVCVVCGIFAIGIHYIMEPSDPEGRKPTATSMAANEEHEGGQQDHVR